MAVIQIFWFLTICIKIAKPFWIYSDILGLRELLKRLAELSLDMNDFIIGIESTGAFSENFYSYITDADYKVILLNVALLLMGVGLGVFIAIFVTTYTALDKNAVYPAVIFLMAGLSLFIGFYMTKNLDK